MSGDGYAGCDGGEAEEWDRLREENKKLKEEIAILQKIPVGLNTHCPNTMLIVGAALSGGDAIELAKKLDRK